MRRVEFKLSMPGVNSWNGQWSSDGKLFLKWHPICDKTAEQLELSETTPRSWSYSFGDGWRAQVEARIMKPGERRRKSEGFCGYDWMVFSIIYNGEIKPPKR